MKKKHGLLGTLVLLLVFGLLAAGCATIPTTPTAVEGYWRVTSTSGGAEAQAAVDDAMENVGQFFVFTGGAYYKGMGVLPHEKGTFVLDNGNIKLRPTHNNTGLLSNTVKWSKIATLVRAVYPEKSLPYSLSGDIIKLVDMGMQQSYRKVDPFFSFDKKGNLVFQIK
jgi:hypothetical protein